MSFHVQLCTELPTNLAALEADTSKCKAIVTDHSLQCAPLGHDGFMAL